MSPIRIRGSVVAALVTVALLAAVEAKAAPIVVGFDGLVNFQNYSEDGVNVTSDDLWNWPGAQMAHIDFGDATFELATLGDFSLLSVNRLQNGGDGASRFEGFLNNVLVASVDVAAFGVYNFGAAFGQVDRVVMSVPGGLGAHYTVDDLTLQVPEPVTLAMLGAGFTVAMVRRRRGHKATA